MAYLFYFVIYQFGVLACILVLVLALEGLQRLLRGSPFEKYVSLAVIGILACLAVGASWLSHEAARRTVQENEHPLAVWRSMLDDLRLLLSGLPWIGRFLRPRPPKRSPFDGPDDARLS